ncbi:MAG: PQQ-binding-like beta-propeller repeat protein [Planctomycetaceae bacterium]|nr:PQQ-binding-like beta-propeller repeat protein [Planctomycetaceae bacterium]
MRAESLAVWHKLGLLAVGVATLWVRPCSADDLWPQWRGANGNGIVPPSNFPLKWSNEENVLFRYPLPGPAGSTPVVAGDRIFLTTAAGDDLHLLCLSTSGQELWNRKITTGNQTARGDEGNSAAPSPFTDGKHVWAMFGNGTLVCFTVDGEETWRRDLQADYGAFDIQFGMTSTPVLHDGVIFLQLIHGPWNREPSVGVLAALDAKTGEQKWMVKRQTDAYSENKHSYASPVIYDDGTYRYFICHGADYVTGHDLETGAEIWRCGGLNPASNYNEYLRFVSSPAVGPGLIVAPTAKSGAVIAIRPGGKGDITGSEFVAWKVEEVTPDVPSPIVTDKYVYLCRENGIVVCLDSKTGDVLYKERTNGHNHRASPVLSGDRWLITSRQGVITVLKAGSDFEVLAVNEMKEPIASSPVIVGDRLYIRSFDALYAIGTK